MTRKPWIDTIFTYQYVQATSFDGVAKVVGRQQWPQGIVLPSQPGTMEAWEAGRARDLGDPGVVDQGRFVVRLEVWRGRTVECACVHRLEWGVEARDAPPQKELLVLRPIRWTDSRKKKSIRPLHSNPSLGFVEKRDDINVRLGLGPGLATTRSTAPKLAMSWAQVSTTFISSPSFRSHLIRPPNLPVGLLRRASRPNASCEGTGSRPELESSFRPLCCKKNPLDGPS